MPPCSGRPVQVEFIIGVSIRGNFNYQGDAQMKEIIESGKAPAAIGPYSQAVEAGGLVFVLSLIHI